MDQQQEVFYKFRDCDKRIKALSIKDLSKWSEAETLLNQTYDIKQQQKFQSLHSALQQMKQMDQFLKIIPQMLQKAIQMLEQQLKIPILNHQNISLTRFQIYTLMTLVFFGLTIKQDIYKFHPQINMQQLLSVGQVEKVKCIIWYFIQGINYQLDDLVIFNMNTIQQHINWLKSDCELIQCKFQLGKNEDKHDCAVVDFSDTLFSGKTLSQQGCAQEEIILLIYPEAIIASILSVQVQDEQAITIQNVIRYSDYTGYEDSFKFIPRMPTDYHQDIVAIDAIYFATKSLNYQYTSQAMERELNKAFIGFEGTNKSISTGKWGCGIYGGNKELKCIIQWISASQAKKFIIFNCLEDKSMMNLQIKFQTLKDKYKTIGQLVQILFKIKTAKDLNNIF